MARHLLVDRFIAGGAVTERERHAHAVGDELLGRVLNPAHDDLEDAVGLLFGDATRQIRPCGRIGMSMGVSGFSSQSVGDS